jgi:hypothetical protein
MHADAVKVLKKLESLPAGHRRASHARLFVRWLSTKIGKGHE